MLLIHHHPSIRIPSYFIVIPSYLLLCALILTSVARAATTTGQQHGPSQGFAATHPPQPTLHSQKPTPMLPSTGPNTTTATFVIPPQSSTTPKPTVDVNSSSNNNFHFGSLQHSSGPAPSTPAPTVSTTPRSPLSAITPGQPSTLAPFAPISTVGTPQPPATIEVVVSRPETTVAPLSPDSELANSTVASLGPTTPSSEEPFMFTTFAPELRTNKSHEELTLPHTNTGSSFHQPSISQPDTTGSSVAPQDPVSTNFDSASNNSNNYNSNMPSLAESSQDPRSHYVNNNFAQAPPLKEDSSPQAQPENSMTSASVTTPEQAISASQIPPLDAHSAINSTLEGVAPPQNNPLFNPISNNTNMESREMTGRVEESNNPSVTFEARSQDQAPQLGRPSSTQVSTASTTNLTNPIEKKHQILKPKSKFKCTQSSECHNGGLCYAGKCYCASGFTGDSCDTNIDECLQAGPEPCQNNGKCVDEINGYKCECPLGYRGDFCQELADMCVDSPCRNNATCINQHTNYTCNCKPGWEGRHCDINIDDCAKGPCQNGATCQDLVDNYKCDCVAGFAGTNCEINVDDCASNPCQNNATCHDLTNDYECECPPGFTEKNCQVNIDECASNPCGLRGDCTDLVDGYKCTCHDGWRGDHCDLDVNECENRNVCANNATCVNTNGGFQCKCRDGFSGKKCADISDYCKAKQPCNFNGICKNTRSNPPFRCECFSGYLGSQCDRKRTCKPGDCNLDHAHCVSNTTCACLPGRREERTMCEYVTSCEQVEGDLCLHGGTCRNLDAGGYHCTCQDPWYGPVCQFRAETQIDAILLVVITCVGFLLAACAVVSLVIFRSVRKARATRGTYSPSTQEKFGNSASDLLKPPNPERLI